VNEEFPNIRHALAASFGLHALFFLLARGVPPFWVQPPVEIDLGDAAFLGSGPARLAPPKAKIPEAKGIPLPAEPDKPVEPAKPIEQPKDWVAPSAETKKVEKPPENVATPGGVTGGTGISPLPGGIDGKSPYGTPNGTGDGGARLTSLPKLLNLDELLKLLQKYYPENERRAGREGDVLLKVHILADGTVGGSEIVHADAEDFGAAAQKVAMLMRFSPAMNGATPVPVAMKVPMRFRLRD
jgi:TonB family protein